MSKVIDEKVVSMRFDNQDFERNAKQSLNTIDNLKQSLTFNGVEKGFQVISNATDSVKMKFSAMEVVAITAISNITNKAVNAGEQLIKSLSVDNISAGWEKFGDKTVSVGTLISQGYSLDEVNEQLDRLNWFTDETSYNFTDMVANIAKFTATGKGLTDSVTAMEGIANWAALSGQNAQTASRAMYQISQAMGAGVMRLEDYKSIQNASMDTDEFRQKALDAALALGTLKKVGKDAYQSVNGGDVFTKTQFTTQLTEGAWFTSDVMMRVFNDYSAAVDQIYEYSEDKGLTASEAIEELGDQVDAFGLKAFKAAQEARTWGDVIDSVKDAVSTGWMNTFELVFGNYEEAKQLWTDAANELYDVFAEGGNQRNELLGWWKEQGGRDLLIEAVYKQWEAFRNILGAVKEGFRDVFPAMTGERLLGLTLKLNLFTEKLSKLFQSVEVDGVETNENLIKIRTVVSGIFSVVKIGINILTSAFKIIKNLSTNLVPLVKYLTDGAYALGQWFTNVGKSAEETNIFGKAVEKVTSVIQKAIDKVKEFAKFIWSKFEAPGWETFFNIIHGIWDIAKKLGKIFFDFIKDLGINLAEALRSGDIKAVIDIFNGTLFATILMKIKGLVGGLGDIADVGKGFKGTITELFDSVKDSMTTWQNSLKASVLMKIALAIGILTLSLIALTGIDQEKLGGALGSISVLFIGLFAEMKGFASVAGGLTGSKIGATLIEFSVAILILSSAVAKLAKLDTDKVAVATGAVTILIYVLAEMFNNLNRGGYIKEITRGAKLYKESITKTSFAMIEFAIAIYILVAAVERLAKFSPQEIATGVGGVVILIYVVTEMMDKLNSNKGFRFKKDVNGITLNDSIKSTGFALIEFAGAIYILTLAVDKIARYSPQEIITGVGGVVVLMYVLTELMDKMNTNKGFLFKKEMFGFTLNESIKSTGFALVEFAGAIYILVLAVDKIAHYSPQEIATGVGGVVVLMYVLTEMLEKLQKSTKNVASFSKGGGLSINEGVKSVGFALIEFAGAIYILTLAVDKIAHYSPQEIATGVGGIVVLMYAMVELLGKLNDGSKTLKTSTKDAKIFKESTAASAFALIEFAGAIYIVTLAVEKLAKLDLESLAKGIGGVSVLMFVMTETLSRLGNNLDLIQAGLALIAFSVGITVLAKAVTIIGSMSLGDMVQGLIGLAAVLAIVVGAVEILQGFTKDLYAVGGAFALFGLGIALIGAGLLSLSLGLAALAGMSLVTIGAIIANVQLIIIGVLDTIAGSAEAFGRAIIAVVIAACQVVIQCAPQIIEAWMVLLEEIAKALATRIPTIVDYLFTFLIEILRVLQNRLPELIQEFVKFLGAFFEAIKGVVGDVDTTSLVEALASITLVTGLVYIFSSIMPLIPGAMVGVLGIAAVLAELTLIIAAIGALSMIPGFNTLVEGGGNLLGLIGSAIGQFFGGILGGIVEGFTSNLPQVGTDLSLFMTNLTPFIMGAKMIDSEMLESVGILTGIILALTVADVINSVTSWLTGGSSLSDFAEQLVPFGNSMVDFSNTISGKIDTEAVNAAANAGMMMAAMASDIPNSGGVLGFLAGNNDLDDFGQKLVAFGSCIVTFSNLVTDASGNSKINTEAVEAAANAGSMMAAMAGDIPNSGGVLGFLKGNNDIDDFGAKLVSFGSNIATFSNQITNKDGSSKINTEAVEAAATAGSIMAAMAQDIPNSGGLLSFITGENNIDDFGAKLVSFGSNIATFSSLVTNKDGSNKINTNAVEAAANAGKMLAEMAETLPNQGGIISWFAGDNDLESFGKGLEQFGQSLDQFRALTSNIDLGHFSSVIRQIEKIVDISKGMADVDTDKMEDFSGSLTTLANYGVDNFIKAFDNSKSRIEKAAKDMMTNFITSASNYKSKVVGEFSSMMSESISKIEGYYSEFERVAKYLLTGHRNGAFSVSSITTKVYTSMIESTITALEKYQSKFNDTGKLLMQGLADGMTENQDIIKTAAESLVIAAQTAIEDKAKIESPSKLFRSIGAYIPMGFALGIEDETQSVVDAIDYLTDQAYNETIGTLTGLNDLLNSGVEVTPVIAPVYDPSNLARVSTDLTANMYTEVIRPVYSLGNQILDAQTKIEESNNRVIESINSLGQNIVDLTNAQDKEIVLYSDTTKLASSLAKPLDRQLEAIARRRR